MSKYVGTDGYKFKVEPDLLNNKVTEVNNALILIAGIIKEIEDIFQEITNGEMWLGPLSENFKEEFNKFLTSNSSEESMTTAGGANAVSSSVENYSQVLRTFLNDASGGYFFADEEAAKFRPLVEESTTISPEQVNGETTMSDATNDAVFSETQDSTQNNNLNNVSTESYGVPNGQTYAKQIQSINSLSEKKNADGSYYYKASAIAYGGTDSSGKKWDTKTEEGTGLRYVEENGEKYYCAAMGTMYGTAGDKVKVTTDTGQTFNVIITDSKSVRDAETVNIDGETYSQYHYWGNGVKDLVELNCDYSKVPKNVKNMGSWHVLEQFSGNVVSIESVN